MPRTAIALLALMFFACSSAHSAGFRPLRGSKILWDRYGVAHVYGKSVNDLFYGFGWAQAHSHREILARRYSQARGRATEYS
jgi:acyl-homoserine-lactone acylase